VALLKGADWRKLLAAAGLAGPALAALAQGTGTTPPPPAPDQPAAGTTPQAPQQLQEVVVTAQKMKTTLEQVPASVTSISGDYIRKTGVRSFQELSNYTANTNLQVQTNSSQLLIRGLGTLNDVPGLDPSVGVVIDGVVYTYPEYLAAFWTDLDRYEVLRGPQGTLSGKNTTAGLLNITTNAPDLKENLFRTDVDWRSYGNVAYRPVVNLALGEGTALRFAGDFEHGDRGQLYNTDLNRPEMNPQQDTGRMRFRYVSPDGWTMDIGAFVSYNEENFNNQELYIVGPNMLALDRSYDPRFNPVIGDFISENVKATQNASTRGASITFEGDLGHPNGMKSLKLISISSAADNVIGSRDIDADFSPVPFIHDGLYAPEPEIQVTQELRVTGVSPDFFGFGHQASFVAGLYYDNYSLDTSDNFQIEDLGATLKYIIAADCDQHNIAVSACTPLAGATGTVLDDLLSAYQKLIGQPLIAQPTAQSGLAQRTKDYAAFGRGEWYFLEHWSLIAGLRYGKEDRIGTPHSYSDSEIIKLIAKQVNFNETLRRVESDFQPTAGIKFQPSQHTEGYFTWAEGYKSGGFNGIPLNPTSVEYQPEKAASLEAGFKIKDRLFGGPIRGSFSVFHTHFGNLQVSTFEGTNVVVVNAADARSQGFEADATWLMPIKGLSLYSSIGFADARYTTYLNGPAAGDGKCPGVSHSAGTCDLTGYPLPFAPQWTATMTPAYTFLRLPYDISTGVAMDILYQGQRYLNPEDDSRTLQKSTLILNPHLVMADDARDDWGLSLGIQNLTKQTYADQVIDQPLAPGNYAGVRADRGRFYTGSLYYNFR
jgi:iron complex outermembrane recepter protein